MSYGKVISGGAQMRKGLTKNINNKLDGFAKENERRAMVAGAVQRAYKVDTLSEQHTNNVRGGKFIPGTRPAKV
jgi:hypothetical protein